MAELYKKQGDGTFKKLGKIIDDPASKSDIPSVGNGTVTITTTKNGFESSTSFNLNDSDDTTIDIDLDEISVDAATSDSYGGIKIGYSLPITDITTKNYAVKLDSSGKAYVNVPWSDTNTWRGIQNNLTSTSTSDSLSAYQGKVLNESKLSLSGGTLTGAVTFANNTWNTVGDDVKIGDHNIAGALAIMGANGNTRIDLCKTDDATNYKSIVYNGSNITIDGVTIPTGRTNNSFVTTDDLSSYMTISKLTGYTTNGQNYAISKDSSGNAYVNVPWVNTTYSAATTTAAGLMSASDKTKLNKLSIGNGKVTLSVTPASGGDAFEVGSFNLNDSGNTDLNLDLSSYSIPEATASTTGGIQLGYKDTKFSELVTRNYAVQLSDGKAFVNVPWVNTTYSNATASASGLMSASDKTKLEGIAANANNYSLPTASDSTLGGIKTNYSSSGKNYAVKTDSSGNAYVNVNWSDTNTWRGIQNNLTSTSTTDSLSAYQGYMLSVAKVNRQEVLAAGVDLNTVTTSGFYRLQGSCTNGFDNAGFAQLLVVSGGGDTIAQFGMPYASSTVYIRNGNVVNNSGGTWQAWKTLASTSDLSSALGSYLKYSTLDAAINAESTGSSTPTDADYYISQYVGGGTTTTSYHRRPHSALFSYIKGKLANVATSGSYNDLSNKPTSIEKATNDSDGNQINTTYVKKSGSTFNSGSTFAFADPGLGNITTSAATYLGGFTWTGKTDGVKLFGECPTDSDQCLLVMQFVDDNSNYLSIRNASGTQTATINAAGAVNASALYVNGSNVALKSDLSGYCKATYDSSTGVLNLVVS